MSAEGTKNVQMDVTEEQRRRIVKIAAYKGVNCPEMVIQEAFLVTEGNNRNRFQVNYRCTKDAPLESLDLSRPEAANVWRELGGLPQVHPRSTN